MIKRGPNVKGKLVDENTRCIHYHSAFDVIAIKFKCCGEYYPCYYCHKEEAGHNPIIWGKDEFDTRAILCGVCKSELSIREYLSCDNHCPICKTPFNPNCNKHHHLYFEV